MAKVIIDMSMSLDGFVAGPDDGPEAGLGKRGGEHIFDWFTSGKQQIGKSGVFSPEAGVNRQVVEEMLARSGCMLSGRRTYEITQGWGGSHPIPGLPIVILTHNPPKPEDVPRGPSKIYFYDDVRKAVGRAKELAGDKDVGIGSGSVAKQALAAGLVDEIFVHVAPIVLGAGVTLFAGMDKSFRLEPLTSVSGPHVTHLRYRVVK